MEDPGSDSGPLEAVSGSRKSGQRPWRPTSFYLLLAIPIVLLLGLQMITAWNSPKRVALVLSLMFAFFGIVMLRGVMDMFDIARRRFREDRDAFRDTLGDQAFAKKLGRRNNPDRK